MAKKAEVSVYSSGDMLRIVIDLPSSGESSMNKAFGRKAKISNWGGRNNHSVGFFDNENDPQASEVWRNLSAKDAAQYAADWLVKGMV
mgnify:CR=1 FL=1